MSAKLPIPPGELIGSLNLRPGLTAKFTWEATKPQPANAWLYALSSKTGNWWVKDSMALTEDDAQCILDFALALAERFADRARHSDHQGTGSLEVAV